MQTLKRGIALFHTHIQGQYLLGTFSRAIRINSSTEKFELTRALAGEVPSVEITDRLSRASLIDSRKSSITVSKRYTSDRERAQSKPSVDAGYLQMQERISPELSQTTWVEGVDDSGVELLSARQRYIVELSGNSRVATILFPMLLASGVSRTRFTSAARGNFPLIRYLDLGISIFTQRDIGLNFRTRLEALRHELALFPLDKDCDYSDESTSADIKIHCGEIDPETLSLWMSSGQAFLPVSAPVADRVVVGPLVIPGESPCLRCYSLITSEQSGVTEVQILQNQSPDEIPIVASHAIAALVASAVLSYLDSKTLAKAYSIDAQPSELVGSAINIDYQSLAHPQVVALSRHPLCGCAFNLRN